MWQIMNAKSNNERSFTLLELVVVMAVISIMSAIVFAGAGNRRNKLALQRSAHKLSQDIRVVEGMGMSSKEFRGSVPAGGYGIHFDISKADHSYILFADKNANHKYDSGEKLETIKLEKGIKIYHLSPGSPLDITFVAPNPIVNIIGGGVAANKANIMVSIENNSNGRSRSVYVNKAGLIYVH